MIFTVINLEIGVNFALVSETTLSHQIDMNRRILLSLGICAVIFTGCRQQSIQEEVREVPTMTVAISDSVSLNERFSATIEGRQDVEIYPQLSGKLMRICVKEGQEVNAGQLLFVIDQVPYQAALRMATANVHAAASQVATARLERDSKQALFDGKVISEYELQTVKNALAVAEAALEQAKAAEVDARNNLSYTEIKSPVKGVVGTLPYRVGALVSPQIAQPLTSVSDNAEMWVYFSISEKQLQGLMRQHGSKDAALSSFPPVSLTLSDGQEYAQAGRVETISGVVNPQTGAVQIKCVFPNSNRLLFSGSTGNVIMPHTERNVMVIPKNATYEIQDKIYTYKVVDGKAISNEITVAPMDDGNSYMVRSGLNSGDVIVTEGVGSLRDGQEIRIREGKK